MLVVLGAFEPGNNSGMDLHVQFLGPVEVAGVRREIRPVSLGPADDPIQPLPLLLAVGENGSVAVRQVVTVEGQVQFLLPGQFGQDGQLVGGGDVEEGLEAERIARVIVEQQLQPHQGRGGHFDQVPAGLDRLIDEIVDVLVRRVADVDDAAAALDGQAAVAGALEDLADRRRQLVTEDHLAQPDAALFVPA